MTLYLRLYWEFFKTGLFAIGGGMATLPFLKDIGATTGWFSQTDLMNMLAVSESTPGPVGINMATYVGYTVGGVPGAIVATIGEVTPSIIVILIVAAMLAKFRDSQYVANAFYGLRPATVGLIAAAALLLMNSENFIDYKSFLIFGSAFILTWKFKINPILMIILARRDQLARHHPCAGAARLHALHQKDQGPAPDRLYRSLRGDRRRVPLRGSVKDIQKRGTQLSAASLFFEKDALRFVPCRP